MGVSISVISVLIPLEPTDSEIKTTSAAVRYRVSKRFQEGFEGIVLY